MHVRLSGGGQSAAARHYAICDDEDAYQGTISLKDIDVENGTAEYAIVLRRQAQGKGYASFATREILRIAFEELGLHKVYLNVWKENAHAVGFYEHMGFRALRPVVVRDAAAGVCKRFSPISTFFVEQSRRAALFLCFFGENDDYERAILRSYPISGRGCGGLG